MACPLNIECRKVLSTCEIRWDNAQDKAQSSDETQATVSPIFVSSDFFSPLLYHQPRDWWSRYSDVGCVRRMHHVSSRLWKPVPSVLWSVDRHSPFVPWRGPKIFIFMVRPEWPWKKGRERTRRRNSNAERNGKKKGSWQDFENDGHTMPDARSNRHMRLFRR